MPGITAHCSQLRSSGSNLTCRPVQEFALGLRHCGQVATDAAAEGCKLGASACVLSIDLLSR